MAARAHTQQLFFQVLSAANNELESIPETVGDLSALTDLRIDSNQITALPIELGYLTSLTAVSLHGNPLRSPPPEIVARGERETVHYLNGFTTARITYELDISGLRLTQFPEQVNRIAAHLSPDANIFSSRLLSYLLA